MLIQLMSFRKGGLNNSFCIFSKLRSFVDEFVSSMAHEGFVKQEYDHVKLHATIFNSIFRQQKQDTDKPQCVFIDLMQINEYFPVNYHLLSCISIVLR